jgi:hypothetical protein
MGIWVKKWEDRREKGKKRKREKRKEKRKREKHADMRIWRVFISKKGTARKDIEKEAKHNTTQQT